jgi:hypothetical protein
MAITHFQYSIIKFREHTFTISPFDHADATLHLEVWNHFIIGRDKLMVIHFKKKLRIKGTADLKLKDAGELTLPVSLGGEIHISVTHEEVAPSNVISEPADVERGNG